MIPINACRFVTDMIRCIAAQHGIEYAPTVTYKYLPLVDSVAIQNKLCFISVEEVAYAVNKIGWFERYMNEEEFHLLLPNVGQTRRRFTTFFEVAINPCYFPDNSPFNVFEFMRYLAYVSSFAIFCYLQGSIRALDFACFAIMRTIFRGRWIFRNRTSWQLIINEAENINACDFADPGLYFNSA